MNRHFNGPAHGLPLNILNYHGDVFRYKGGTEQWTSFARVIQDELFVQRTLVIWHPGDLGLQELLDRLYFPICLHISSNTKRHEAGYANSDGLIRPEGKYVGKARRQPGSLLGSRRCPWAARCEYRPECEEHYNAEENHPPRVGLFGRRLTWWYPAEGYQTNCFIWQMQRE
ncbi:hypothetical protein FMUND_7015 [Fusarium mundagurra]|uniref:Uncharacterized protein n=1 Tax=Fusarium mundagurra TaxID=1567541 RepID=A0A8H5YMS3_9HYPO|nr:hypothetical protein FMUND_7015 [Fusarium mundagurra]